MCQNPERSTAATELKFDRNLESYPNGLSLLFSGLLTEMTIDQSSSHHRERSVQRLVDVIQFDKIVIRAIRNCRALVGAIPWIKIWG